ncbi:hypothetical protein B0H14DRAFT_3879032 [Mycena olivaceomarginata]|nr:hypothetical protein B0H14DRAFT_3879032 [Mycena olivaceomarginata]
MPRPDQSPPAQRLLTSITIVNAGINETIFTFAAPPPLEVLLPAFGREDQHATWDRYERRADAWVFRNRGTQQWLAVNEADEHLITVGDESNGNSIRGRICGKGASRDQLPNANKVFEPIFDGTSMLFGRVGLGPATGMPVPTHSLLRRHRPRAAPPSYWRVEQPHRRPTPDARHGTAPPPHRRAMPPLPEVDGGPFPSITLDALMSSRRGVVVFVSEGHGVLTRCLPLTCLHVNL